MYLLIARQIARLWPYNHLKARLVISIATDYVHGLISSFLKKSVIPPFIYSLAMEWIWSAAVARYISVMHYCPLVTKFLRKRL